MHRAPHRFSRTFTLLLLGVGVMLAVGWLIWKARHPKEPARNVTRSDSAHQSDHAAIGSLLTFEKAPPGRRPPPSADKTMRGRGEEIVRRDPSYRDPESLVTHLTTSSGRLSATELDQLNRDLQALTAMGNEAIPFIREYLNKFEDIPLASTDREMPVPYPTMRLALLDVVKQIGGSEAIALELEILGQTTAPREIAFLGEALEEQQPGRHLDQVLNTSLEVLAMAAEKQLPSPELAPIFRLLGSYSDEAAISALEESIPHWERYSMMALAQTPEGNGVPSIVNQIQEGINRHDRNLEKFGWELLAQVAFSNPVARDYLVKAASSNVIPDELWSGIAMHAAGNAQYQMVRPEQTDPLIRESYTSHRFHKDNGLQGDQLIFRWRPRPSSISDQLEGRREVLDALMQATSSAEAQLALKAVRHGN